MLVDGRQRYVLAQHSYQWWITSDAKKEQLSKASIINDKLEWETCNNLLCVKSLVYLYKLMIMGIPLSKPRTGGATLIWYFILCQKMQATKPP